VALTLLQNAAEATATAKAAAYKIPNGATVSSVRSSTADIPGATKQTAARWTGYNLALRLITLGYRQVLWYRGGREAWEVAGLPMDRARVVTFSAQ
jgi:hypothetical protein